MTVNDNVVPIRRLDVTARLTDQVMQLSERADGGVLLETLIGRYVLDRDARKIWLLIDGRRDIGQIIEETAKLTGLPTADVEQATRDLCDRLLELGLVEVATPADTAALSR